MRAYTMVPIMYPYSLFNRAVRHPLKGIMRGLHYGPDSLLLTIVVR